MGAGNMASILAIAGLVAGIAVSGLSAAAADRPTGKKVFLASGHDTVSALKDPDYQKVFRSIFADQSLTLDTSGGADSFISGFVESDIVYVNVHANPGVMIAGNGERVEVLDLARAYHGRGAGPALAIVTGCKTLKVETKVNFAHAVGIDPGTPKRAYIGFDTLVFGAVSDRYFRVFLAHWMKPKNDGGYRTLSEARDDAKAFIERIIAQTAGSDLKGKLMKFSQLEANIADKFEIVGDSSLQFTDLGAAPTGIGTSGHAHSASGADIPASGESANPLTGAAPQSGGFDNGGFQGSIGGLGGGSPGQPWPTGGENTGDANRFLRE